MLDSKLVMHFLTGACTKSRMFLTFVIEEAGELLIRGGYYTLFI